LNKIYTTHQVSDILHVHLNTVYKYIKSGKLKAFKLSGRNSVKHWRIREENLESFLKGAESEHGEIVAEDAKPDRSLAQPPRK